MVQELLKDPQQAALLAQFHQLYHVQGLPFGQAWSQAQLQSGVTLDVEQVADKLLGNQQFQLDNSSQDSFSAQQDYQENRKQVESAPIADVPATPEIKQADQQLQNAKQTQQQKLPAPGEQFYQNSRAIDRTIRDSDDEVMVIPDRSLWREGDKRLTEVLTSSEDDKK